MDAIAFRTRARCKEPAPQPCRKKPRTAALSSQRGRRRLRRPLASESQHEDLNNNNSPEPTSDEEQGDSVASNELRSPDGHFQRKPAGSRNRRRCVVSPPTTSASLADSDVVIVGEFQSDDRDGAASQPQAKRPCLPLSSPEMAVNKPPFPDKPEGDDDLDSDEELRIVGMVGQVATRDLPHPRPDCAEHRFVRDVAAAESNTKCCEQCYCFVCDVKASECQFWGTGRRERDHANARPHPAWNALRQAARAGDKALVRWEFEGEGPLSVLPLAAAAMPRGMHSHQLQQLLQQQQQSTAILLSQMMQRQQQSRRQREREAESGHGTRGGGSGAAGEAAAAAGLDFGSDVDTFLAAMLRFGRPGTAVADGGDFWAQAAAAAAVSAARPGGGRSIAGRGQQQQSVGPVAAGAASAGGGSGAAWSRGPPAPSALPHSGPALAATATAAATGAAPPGAASPGDLPQARPYMPYNSSAAALHISTARGQQTDTPLGGISSSAIATAAAAFASESRAAAAAQLQPYNETITQQTRESRHVTAQHLPRRFVLNKYVPQQVAQHNRAQEQLQPQHPSFPAVPGMGVSPQAPMLLLPPHLPSYQQNQLQLQNHQSYVHHAAATAAAVQTEANQPRKGQEAHVQFQTHVGGAQTGAMQSPSELQQLSSYLYGPQQWIAIGQNPVVCDGGSSNQATSAAPGVGFLPGRQQLLYPPPPLAVAAAVPPAAASVPAPGLQHAPGMSWTAVHTSSQPLGPLRLYPIPAPSLQSPGQ